MIPEPISLRSCPKAYSVDLDKACSPLDTIKRAQSRLEGSRGEIYAGSRRIDCGRLGIPVFMGICGPKSREIMPTRKQMGKGSSPEQAEASAMMEFMERYAFFSFWQNPDNFIRASWSKAEQIFGSDLIPISEMLLSVKDSLDSRAAREILDLVEWQFYPATNLETGKICWLPLDWFKMLGEFNGSSAGNTNEESLLQGALELVERHVCAIVDRERPELPTIDSTSCKDKRLSELIASFRACGINLTLKDMSLDTGIPTVGAVAWDESTFPDSSEIVFTAGTATSPEKAAIRAITEVAQLGGDFCMNACYEASGLPKFRNLADIEWLLKGPSVRFEDLPDSSSGDIRDELLKVASLLAPINLYGIATTNPELQIPAHYSVAPGLQFRERDKNQSLGLFVGRKLIEEGKDAQSRLETIAKYYPDAHFLSFFAGQMALNAGDTKLAAKKFEHSYKLQPEPDSRSLAAFYAGYSLAMDGAWLEAQSWLQLATQDNPEMKEAYNLLGVACFKLQKYAEAEEYFSNALKIDKGSAMDLANRGVVRKLQGKKSGAISDLENALKLQPDLDFAVKHLEDLVGNA